MAWLFPNTFEVVVESVSTITHGCSTTRHWLLGMLLQNMSIIVELLDFKDTDDRSSKDDLGSIRETTLAEQQGTRLGAGIETYPAIFNFTTDSALEVRGVFENLPLCWVRFAGKGYQSIL